MTVVIACAQGTADSGVLDESEGGVDAARDVLVIPDDSATLDNTVPEPDGAIFDSGTPETSPAAGSVVINELQSNGPLGASDEFVELYNRGTAPVTLLNWEVKYESSGGSPGGAGHKFTTATVIAPGAYLVLRGATWSSGMAAAAGQVGLLDDNAKLVDGVGYGAATTNGAYREKAPAPSPPIGGSIGRSPNGVDTKNNAADFKAYPTATVSPGAANP